MYLNWKSDHSFVNYYFLMINNFLLKSVLTDQTLAHLSVTFWPPLQLLSLFI